MLPLLLSLLAPTAQAQGVNAHGLHLAPDAGDTRAPTLVRTPLRVEANDYGFQLLGEYAYGLVVQARQPSIDAPIDRRPLLKDIWAANLSAHAAVHSHGYLDVHIPMYLAARGSNQTRDVGLLGDIRMAATVLGLRAPSEGGWAASGHTWVDLPTGDAEAFLGSSGVGGGIGASASWSTRSLLVSSEVGLGFRPALEQDNLTGSDALIIGAGVGGVISDTTSLTAELRAGLPWSKSPVPGTGRTLEGVATARMLTNKRSSVRVGLAYGLSRGIGVPSWRLLAGGSFGNYSAPLNEPFSVRSTAQETCPDGSAPVVGRTLEDGCYVPLTIVTRYGNKTLSADIKVRTPSGETTASVSADGWRSKALPGDLWVVEAQSNGCLIGAGQATIASSGSWIDVPLQPVRDAQLKVQVEDDEGLPVVGATATWSGAHPDCFSSAPASNVDGSMAVSLPVGTWSLQVTHPNHGPSRTDVEVTQGEPTIVRVVLPKQRMHIRDGQVVFKERFAFADQSADLGSTSAPLLDELAGLLTQRTELALVAIAGHTDNTGEDLDNLKLSMARAKAIVAGLVQRGVEPSRLEAQGFGSTEPISTNRTAKGRNENMRIEVRILETREDTP